jgi:hypothetical protein
MDARVAAELTALGVAFTYKAPITHINHHGDTAIHTASFKITGNGHYIDIFNKLYNDGDPLPKGRARQYRPRYDTVADVTETDGTGTRAIREKSILHTIRTIWFQNDAETIDANVHIILVNPFLKIRGNNGKRVTYATYFSGLTPGLSEGYDPVMSWGFKLDPTWLE